MFETYKDILTVDEFCEALGIGKNVAYDVLSSGNVKAFRIGRDWKIPKESVEDYIKYMIQDQQDKFKKSKKRNAIEIIEE